MCGLQSALSTLGLHSGSVRPKEEDGVRGVGRGGRGLSGWPWRVGQRSEKTAGIKSSVRMDEIQASGRGSEEKPE